MGNGMKRYQIALYIRLSKEDSWKAKITVKTRLGLTDNSEFADLLKVYSKFPIYELTIHPRFKSDYYSGTPRLDEFSKLSSMISDGKCFGLHNTSICYNGDINASDDKDRVVDEFPFISSVMCGRGALANPALFRELKGGQKLTKDEFISFHNDVYDTYKETVAKERYFLHRMQEMWTFWNQYFKFDQELVTTLRRVSNIAEYLEAINNLIDTIPD
ncbi:MAG: tRNA-dihydrouridine synthase [Lachnospiraceae bacterium]|nr:tRNA-dihydrouridine synthase [Lachnospiraceae bacterium]